MKIKNKALTFLLALAMMVGVLTPNLALAFPGAQKTGEVAEDKFTETEPTTTTLNIYKLQADSYKEKAPWQHTGGVISPDKYTELGTNVKGLVGVTFTIYKLKDGNAYKDISGRKLATVKSMEVYTQGDDPKATKVGDYTTNEQGLANTTLEKGYYWIVESGKPNEVSSSLAVPFGILLPFANPFEVGNHAAGSGFLTEVNVYPKNVTAPLPTVKKYVDEVGTSDSSHNAKETFKWIIETEIPTNIKDYKQFYITDMKPSGVEMSASGDGTNPKVYYTDKTILAEIEETTSLVRDTDFLTTNVGVGPQVQLNIKSIKAKQDSSKKLYIVYEAKIYPSAIMGKDMKNGVKLEINNGTKDHTIALDEQNQPKVHTGGKKFKKVSNTGKVLSGAKFIIQDVKDTGNIKYLTGSYSNGYTWTTTKDDAVEFTSNTQGFFEVKGLQDSMKGGEVLHKYQLVETEAPEGYAKGGPVDFEISKTSYYTNPEVITTNTDSDNIQEIVNNEIIIPETGGIGTIIFIVAGFAIMAGAFIAMRKNSAEE